MFSLVSVIDMGPDADDGMIGGLADLLTERGQWLPGATLSVAGKTLPRGLNGGSILWRLAFETERDIWDSRASTAWQADIAPALLPENGVTVDWLAYRADYFDTAVSLGRAGLWRCLVMAVDNGTPTAEIRQFERDLLEMPGHVSAIRNWALGDVVAGGGRRRWTHIWEQEFVDIAGLEGEYMTHPVHWGLVDGWFDPECPQRIVDPMLIHAAMDIHGSIIV